MSGPPGELMTREKNNIFSRMTSELTHVWAFDKTIFRIGIQTQRRHLNVGDT